jgi:hypothetical protein
MTMATDLQTKVEKYEARALQCQQHAREARDKAERGFYEELAAYYASLATDFRTVIEKRSAA